MYEYQQSLLQFQHTAARRRLRNALAREMNISLFQHTAARRRLPVAVPALFYLIFVSTHSRPKAAAEVTDIWQVYEASFNTQPPEGGCNPLKMTDEDFASFNTQPPEGGCAW